MTCSSASTRPQQLLRVDERVTPDMYKGATVSAYELEQLRRIEHVVRRGRVRRIDRDAIVLDDGTIDTSPRHLHVHCAAAGLNPAPAVPMFTADRITLQPIRAGLIPFNAAVVGFVEATRDDTGEKNRLCPVNPLPDVPLDWVRGTIVGMNADYALVEGARHHRLAGARSSQSKPWAAPPHRRTAAPASLGSLHRTRARRSHQSSTACSMNLVIESSSHRVIS